MTQIRSIVIALALMPLFPAWAHCNDVSIADLIASVKREIAVAQQQDTGAPRLRIEQVQLDISIVKTVSGGGGISFRVPLVPAVAVEGDVKAEKRQFHHLKLTLEPESEVDVSPGLQLGLAEAILQVKRDLKESMNKPPAFMLRDFVFEVSFVAEEKIHAGVKLAIIGEANLGGSQTGTQKITVYMKSIED